MRRFPFSSYLNVLLPVCCFIAVAFAIPYLPEGHQYDRRCWYNWAVYMFDHGLSNTYNTDTNYLPLYQYVLYAYAKICGAPETIWSSLSYLRLLTLAFEWLGLWYLYLWTEKKLPYYLLILISLINLGQSYNTLLWGQVDGISSALVFISVYYGYFKKPVLSTLFFVLAVNMKLQSMIFLPVWGYFCLSTLSETKRLRELFLPLLAAAALQLIVLLPFIHHLPRVWQVIAESFGKFPVVSLGAFNFWYLVLGAEAYSLPDSGIFIFNLTYKQSGLILFFITGTIALLPLLRNLYKLPAKKAAHVSKIQVWCIAAIIPIAFFFFPTEMHERYSHPAFLFIMALAVYKNDYFPYLLFSLAYFVNLETIAHSLWLGNSSFIFNPLVVATEYALLLLYLFFRLWQQRPGSSVPGLGSTY